MPKINETVIENKRRIGSPLKIERVKEDNNALKTAVNRMKKEISLFKADRVKYEEELSRKDKLIEEIAKREDATPKAKEV